MFDRWLARAQPQRPTYAVSKPVFMKAACDLETGRGGTSFSVPVQTRPAAGTL
jgi:hypothetical protein